MRLKWFLVTSLLLIGTAACGGSPAATPTLAATATPEQTPTPAATNPSAVSANADWTPQTTVFDGVEMVLVPPGCFMMGNDAGRRDERPAHEQCFAAAYWIGKYEVTNAQYGSPGRFEGDSRPRENLLWSEARDFCASRGARLPTEAEWEYAARGPNAYIYPWGNTLNADNLVFDQNSNGETQPVGSKPAGASWVGALDMSGNVFEFVSSAYARYPFDPADGREDLDNAEAPRVYRGGINSYIDNGAGAAIRFRLDADERNWFIGFRCVRDA
ncbi:MAG: formylglycine-generating enzyme family protein [Anaerolineae bacterium]|nr:formylglycine-generating enzyme family protein [Anaerolineae bacterium]